MKDRREFLKTLLVIGGSGAALPFDRALAQVAQEVPAGSARRAVPHGGAALPAVAVSSFSSEIVLNSRRSYHSGYSGALSTQVLANALWAAARAPSIGPSRTIYAALPDSVYRYDEEHHCLFPHKTGNHLSESSAAFELGVCGDSIEEAGIATHYAHLASCAFWSTTQNQPSCCPKDSAMSHANSSWSPQSTVHLVNCYGRMSAVSGITSQLAAVSSDGSLPNPATQGSIALEDGLASLAYGDQFSGGELTIEQVSQLAWSSFGCTPHTAAGKAAVTVASWGALYFLTGRIYVVQSSAVSRYHVRLPAGGENTKDHRLETVAAGDHRPQLRAALPDLPQTAPNYFVFCAADTQTRHRLEAGFAGGSALLQATSLGLQGFLNAGFTSGERTAIINALSIPSNHLPLVVFSAG